MTIKQALTQIVSTAFAESGYSAAYGDVTNSNRPDLCQFQCNGAMAAAKEYRKAPIMIANDVVAKLAEDSRFSKVEAVNPGFINIDISDELLTGELIAMAESERLGLPTMEKQALVIDFGGPNVAKPLHVGHLRSAIIGDSLRRIATFLGHDVIGDIHLGDWGLQMGLVMAGIQAKQPDLVYFDESYTGEYPAEAPVTADELNTIYPEASARSKVDEEFAAIAAQFTVELQNGRPGYRALWQQIWQVSIADLRKSYDFLNVHFDKWLGESDAQPWVPKVLDLLREKGLLYNSSGAEVVDVALPEDKEPMPPMIILKSNGGEIYGTTDLATLLQRTTEWDPSEVWYVVDQRQALHFKQVFRAAKLAGITKQTECSHVGFGTMNGQDGKPYKTREGGVMRLSDMIETITTNAYRVTGESNVTMSEAELRATADKIGVAALKIGDLVNHRTKDYIFDLDRFLANDGKTGPYLLYTAVRINSVLKKALEQGDRPGDLLPPKSDAERELALSLLFAGDELLRTYAEKAPNILCETMFDIAGRFNRFYNTQKILIHPDAAERASWLSLLKLVYDMLVTLLGLLGIEVPEAM